MKSHLMANFKRVVPAIIIRGAIEESIDVIENEEDRFIELKQGGIAPRPVFLFPRDQSDRPIACIGVECIPPGMANDLVRTIWTQDGT